MLKNYIYLNILFIFGLALYLLSQNLTINVRNSFYLFFSLFSILIPILFLITDYQYQDREESLAYKFLFLGFCLYGTGNLVWYLNDSFNLDIHVNYINILFFLQAISKHNFFKFLVLNQNTSRKNQAFSKIISINLGVLIIATAVSNIVSLNSLLYDFYFIFESILSIFFIYYYLFQNYSSHLDLRYLLLGSLFWLVGDSLYLIEILSGVYFMGNISDFIYFVGFYLLLSSVIFKDFNFKEKINLYFDTNLRFS
jgi:hypothetical protein